LSFYPTLLKEIAMFFRPSLLAAALILASPVANAQVRTEPYAAAIKADCAKEIKSLCRHVQDGRGRVLACLYSQDKRLSPKCATTVVASSAALVEAISATTDLRRACEADAKRHCTVVLPGDGRLVDCLNLYRKTMSQACNAALDTAALRP
jgi:hypothetical protein